MLDNFNREINYLRISITDNCNLSCSYCRPSFDLPFKEKQNLLSFEQITDITKIGAKLGIKKIRLTGGEPLIRPNVENLVFMIKNIDGINEVSITTNGTLLAEKLPLLKKRGLSRINISLDTLDLQKYRYITRGGDLNKVLNGINETIKENLPLKINMVVSKNFNEDEIPKMEKFCHSIGAIFQPISHYSLGQEKSTSLMFKRPPKCDNCNRLRILSDGIIKPCLHSDHEIMIDFNNIEKCLIESIQTKPLRGSYCHNKKMVEIGG